VEICKQVRRSGPKICQKSADTVCIYQTLQFCSPYGLNKLLYISRAGDEGAQLRRAVAAISRTVEVSFPGRSQARRPPTAEQLRRKDFDDAGVEFPPGAPATTGTQNAFEKYDTRSRLTRLTAWIVGWAVVFAVLIWGINTATKPTGGARQEARNQAYEQEQQLPRQPAQDRGQPTPATPALASAPNVSYSDKIIPVATDTQASYYALALEKRPDELVEIVTRRTGPSGTSYASQLCQSIF
jgi:hypothetical protein